MKLGLGTVQFGVPYGIANKTGLVAPAEVRKILKLASTGGIRILDTAAGYGGAEATLGSSFTPSHGFSIVTKTLPLNVARVNLSDVARVEAAFAESLRWLGAQSVNGLLVHNSADLLNPGGERLYDSLREWKSEGKVKKIGVSVYDKEEIDQLFDRFEFDSIQVPLNLFDQRLIENGAIRMLKGQGVEIHARSIFLQGLLLLPEGCLPSKLNQLNAMHKRLWSNSRSENVTPAEAALGFVKSISDIDVILVGVQSCQQLSECLSAYDKGVRIPNAESFALRDPMLVDPRQW